MRGSPSRAPAFTAGAGLQDVPIYTTKEKKNPILWPLLKTPPSRGEKALFLNLSYRVTRACLCSFNKAEPQMMGEV